MTHQSEEVVLDRRLVHLELEAAAVGDFFVKLREFGVVVGFGRSASKLDYPGKKCGFIFKLFLHLTRCSRKVDYLILTAANSFRVVTTTKKLNVRTPSDPWLFYSFAFSTNQ